MKTKIGFIGAGDISILHADGIKSLPNAELKGLWNITPDLAIEKSERYGCRNYDSCHALLSDPEIDAIFVLTSLEAHHKYVMMSLEAGKHVFVEKPVGVNIEEIRDMQSLAKTKNLVCMPGHNYIYEAPIQRTKQLIDDGKLGDLVAVYIMYHIHHPEEVAARCEGVIRQILTHHSYITVYLAGLPKQISAMKSSLHYEELTLEDIAMSTMKMENGALVHFTASFAADDNSSDPFTFSIKVIGTKGAARYSYRDWVENIPGPAHAHTFTAYGETIKNIGAYFIDACLGRSEAPLSDLDDAIAAQKMVEAIEMSVKEKRHVEIDWVR